MVSIKCRSTNSSRREPMSIGWPKAATVINSTNATDMTDARRTVATLALLYIFISPRFIRLSTPKVGLRQQQLRKVAV